MYKNKIIYQEEKTMLNSKRTANLILAAVLIASQTACATNSEPSDNTDKEEGFTSEVSEVEEYKPVTKNCGGYEFRVLIRNFTADSSWLIKDIFSDGENGDAINDAVYKRNLKISENFDIKISELKNDNVVSFVRSDVMSGDSSFDAIQHGISDLASLSNEDALIELNSLGCFNFDREWWDTAMMESIGLSGEIYFALGDINISDNNASWSVLFNKELHKQYRTLNDYYAAVKNGEWTLDILHTDAKAASSDLDGDQNMIWDKDQWGLIGQYRCAPALLASSGNLPLVLKGGEIIYNLNSESVVDAFGKIYDLLTDKNCALMYDSTGKTWTESAQTPFMSRRALFFMTPIATVSTIRDMNDDFGILPLPKLDEKQENYASVIQYNNGTAYSIPNNGNDAYQTGLILEALAFESKSTLTPAYYDVTLKRKIGRDDESSEMLDIIFSSGVFDYSQTYSSIGITQFLMDSCKGENNFASGEASKRSMFLSEIENLENIR